MAFSIQTAWVAVGLGANTMGGNPLVLMAYPSASGENVTISPRRCNGHSEPIYDSEINIETLPGTGILNDTTFVFNGLCTNCRSWSRNGKIDISSTAQEMAYATGASSDTRSNNPSESVKIHWSYGSFTMDLVHATGAGGIPEIPANENITSVGATQQSATSGYSDKKAVLHAVFMILTFVGIWPFGILVLRVGGSVRWHAINQVVAFGLVLIGSILGFVISTSYNRVSQFSFSVATCLFKSISIFERYSVLWGLFADFRFTEPQIQYGASDNRHLRLHFVIAQLVLGYLHHRIYKKTQQPTKIAPIHVWLGRIIIPLGIANGFT